ncbi:hypothetical protein HYU09_00350 [Candidatus Woesearchaeota archaeon]|nr:hypothetical protein [Candidatus Woesearchaeota archaeon]
MIKKAVLVGIVAITFAALASDTAISLNNCAEYRYQDGNEQQAQKFVGGKCFYYYANDSKQELLIYEPQQKQQNIGTLTEIVLDNLTGQIDISRHAVKDLRNGPHPDDANYEFIHEIPIGANEKSLFIQLFQMYLKKLSLI